MTLTEHLQMHPHDATIGYTGVFNQKNSNGNLIKGSVGRQSPAGAVWIQHSHPTLDAVVTAFANAILEERFGDAGKMIQDLNHCSLGIQASGDQLYPKEDFQPFVKRIADQDQDCANSLSKIYLKALLKRTPEIVIAAAENEIRV